MDYSIGEVYIYELWTIMFYDYVDLIGFGALGHTKTTKLFIADRLETTYEWTIYVIACESWQFIRAYTRDNKI